MSTDYKMQLVKDNRMIISDSIIYGVNKGGQQVTSAQFSATSQSPSSQIYNLQVPSLETIVDRHILWTSTIELTITGNSSANTQLINYGNRDCLGPFPLHSMCTNQSATINNNTVSLNTRDVLPAILRLIDNRELARYNNSTPVAYDQYLFYEDMKNQINNVFNGFTSVSDPNIHPRGSFAIDSITNDDNTPMTANGTICKLTFTVTEPLLLSPFLFGGSTVSNTSGMTGIQNLSFNFNMDTTCKRVLRHYGPTDGAFLNTITSVVVSNVTNSSLQLFFLTPHPSDQMPSRCIVPYYELPRYITSTQAIALCTLEGNTYTPGSATVNSSNISLNQVPDTLIVYLRKRNQTYTDSDSFLSIKNISINFNNNTGVCSSFTRAQLWQCSLEAGSNQSYDEFRGLAFKPRPYAADDEKNNAGAGAGVYIRTCGSLLALDFGHHINLVEDYYAPGSIGQFNLQLSVQVENYDEKNQEYELVLITKNSGSFATERGTSSTYTALLTKQDVLEASATMPISTADARRMVGGGWLDNIKSVFKWVANPDNRKELGSIIRTGMNVHDEYKGSKQHEKGRNILSHLGGARSGGSNGIMARLK